MTDKLRSYGVAHRELMPDMIHSTHQYDNNKAEQSHEATRVRERGMRRFKSAGQARRLLTCKTMLLLVQARSILVGVIPAMRTASALIVDLRIECVRRAGSAAA